MKPILTIVALTISVNSILSQNIQLAIQKGHSAEIELVAFDDRGELLASSALDNLIKIWHVRTGKEMATIPNEHKVHVTSLSFTALNDSLLISYENGLVEIWDINSIQRIGAKQSSVAKIRSQQYAKTADSLYAVSIDRFYLNKYRRSNGKKVFAKVPPDISKNFSAVAISQKFNRIVAANQDGGVYAYDLTSGKNTNILSEHLSSVNSVCFTADEELFATASSDRTIIIWDTKTMKSVRRLYGKSFRVESIAFDPSGNFLASGDELGNARIIDLMSTRINISSFKLHSQKISDIKFSHSGDKIFTAGYDNRVVGFDIRKETVTDQFKYLNYISTGDGLLKLLNSYREPYAWVNTIAISPDDQFLVAGGGWRESEKRKQSQPLFIRNLKNGQVKKIPANQGNVSSLDFTKNSSWISSDRYHLYEWYMNPMDRKVYFRDFNLPDSPVLNSASSFSGDSILLSSPNQIFGYDIKLKKAFLNIRSEKEITTVSADRIRKNKFAYATNNDLVIYSIATGSSIVIKQAHTDKITDIDFSPSRPIVATCSWDATVKLWNADTGKLLATIVSIGKNEHIIITADNYYYGTRRAIEGIGFKSGKQFISPEQFDLRFNRPDVVLAQLGFVPDRIVKAYRRAYLKRLQKMNFTEEMLSEEIQLPVTKILTKTLPLNTSTEDISFEVQAMDSKFNIDRLNVFINDVPVYGTEGLSVKDRHTTNVTEQLNLKLSAGKNKIQVSCLNEKGTESLFETFYVDYEKKMGRPNLHLLVISVSNYQDSKMNLKYSKKDGRNVSEIFALKKEYYNNITIDTIFDRNATRETILNMKKRLLQSSVDDQVIIFVSGHGLLDSNLDFYFATYDIDFAKPQERGLKYDDLEQLLNGIPARKKLLMIDACHAGEVDKSTIQVNSQTLLSGKQRGTLTSYTYPVDVSEDHYSVGIKTSFELMQELFSNISKGSGAVVISASAGNSYALESDEWKNGVFTYSLLSGLKKNLADSNRDKKITVTEIKNFVSKEVERLTKGEQKPTSRSENLEFDFRIW